MSQNLPIAFDIQIILGFLCSVAITGGWWFAAVRLRRHWSLYALTTVNTVSLLLSVIMAVMVMFLRHHAAQLIAPYTMLSQAVSALRVLDALSFIAFVAWLVSHVSNSKTYPVERSDI